MASTDSAKKRLAEIAAQTVALFMQESLPDIMRAINVRIKAEFGGEQMRIRKDTADRNAVRDQMILRDRAEGMSARSIAKKYHLTHPRVIQICKENSKIQNR
jgi:Mor family transcriptional regulator